MPWRETERSEIVQYYDQEFEACIDQIPSFIKDSHPKQIALAFREPFPTISGTEKPFIRRDLHLGDNGGVSDGTLTSLDDVLAFIQSPGYIDPLRDASDRDRGLVDPTILDGTSRPVPDAVYYAVDTHNRGWLLVFDIDAKDIARQDARAAVEGDESLLEEAGIIDREPTGYDYEYKHIRRAIKIGFQLKEFLEDILGMSETQVVYSGQGAHVYGVDDGSYHRYDEQVREEMKYYLSDVRGLPIDPVVTSDRQRVMRLPYSLHTGVSRVVQPISSPDFDFQSKAIPDIIKPDNADSIHP